MSADCALHGRLDLRLGAGSDTVTSALAFVGGEESLQDHILFLEHVGGWEGVVGCGGVTSDHGEVHVKQLSTPLRYLLPLLKRVGEKRVLLSTGLRGDNDVPDLTASLFSQHRPPGIGRRGWFMGRMGQFTIQMRQLVRYLDNFMSS